MGWFDEQIRERMKSDQELMEDSLLQIAGAVMGRRASSRLADNQMVAKEALDDVLKYYHYKSVDVPETIRDVNEQLDYVLRPLGLMTRDVELEEGWYKDALAPCWVFILERIKTVIRSMVPGLTDKQIRKHSQTAQAGRTGRTGRMEWSRSLLLRALWSRSFRA